MLLSFYNWPKIEKSVVNNKETSDTNDCLSNYKKRIARNHNTKRNSIQKNQLVTMQEGQNSHFEYSGNYVRNS